MADECRKVRDLLSKKIEELDIKMLAMKEFGAHSRDIMQRVNVNLKHTATPHVVR